MVNTSLLTQRERLKKSEEVKTNLAWFEQNQNLRKAWATPPSFTPNLSFLLMQLSILQTNDFLAALGINVKNTFKHMAIKAQVLHFVYILYIILYLFTT